MNNKLFKITVSVILIIAIIILLYFGALATLKKGKLFIKADRAPYTGQHVTAQQITDNFEKMFNSPSPVGQDEVIKRTLFSLARIASNNELGEDVLVHFAEFAEENAVEKELIHFQYVAEIYNYLYLRTQKQEYLEKVEEYLTKAREIGPKLPQPLESLAILYTRSENIDKLQEITNRIVELWPDHPAVKRQIIEE